MIVLEDYNDNSFKMDGVPHTKVYELKVGADDTLSLVNLFDRADILFSNQPVGNITLGSVFENTADLLAAFENLKKKDDAVEVPPKVFRALIAKSGTNAPVLTILRNTTGATVTTAHTGTGGASITFSSGVLTDLKTGVMVNAITSTGSTIHARRTSATAIFINTRTAGVSTDLTFVEQLIEVIIEN